MENAINGRVLVKKKSVDFKDKFGYYLLMKAVILAGGLGTRLRPVTYEIPKPLITVKKKPILNHLIDFFRRSKVLEIVVLASRAHEDDFQKWHKPLKKELQNEAPI